MVVSFVERSWDASRTISSPIQQFNNEVSVPSPPLPPPPIIFK